MPGLFIPGGGGFLSVANSQSEKASNTYRQQVPGQTTKTEGGGGGAPGDGSLAAMPTFVQSLFGSESGAGMGGMGLAGIIAAAIVVQHGLSDATDTEFEGVKTDDAFAGHFGTEPWFAYAHDKLGLDPTAGEKFDAAVANRDWKKAAKRFPAMVDYWTNPPAKWAASGTKAIAGRSSLGKGLSVMADPVGAGLNLF